MKHLLLLAAVPLILAVPAKANDEAFDHWATEVRTSDLNLATEQGQAKLLARVRSVAERKCQPQGRRSVAEMGLTNQCVQSALEAARPRIDVAIALANEPARMAAGGSAGTASLAPVIE